MFVFRVKKAPGGTTEEFAISIHYIGIWHSHIKELALNEWVPQAVDTDSKTNNNHPKKLELKK